jgi:hypothetical protein
MSTLVFAEAVLCPVPLLGQVQAMFSSLQAAETDKPKKKFRKGVL